MSITIERALVVADTHIKTRVWAKHPELVGDAEAAWVWCCDEAARRGLPLLVLGDIFDSARPAAEDIKAFQRGLDRLPGRGREVYYIQGNHDRATPPWPSIVSDAVWLHRKQLTLCGHRAYGIDYSDPRRLQAELADVPADTEVLLMHQAWSDMMGREAEAGDVARLPCRVLLTGDYHDYRQTSVPTRDGGQILAVSPGSPHLTRTSHKLEKFIVEIGANPEAAICDPFSGIRVPTRPVVQRQLEIEADYEALSAACLAAIEDGKSRSDARIQRPLVHIRYRPEHSAQLKRIQAEFGESCYVIAVPTVTTVMLEDMQDHEFSPTSGVLSLRDAVIARLADEPEAQGIAAALADMPLEQIPAYLESEVVRCMSRS